MNPIFKGKSAGISYIFGEAGIGKTRLLYALKEKIAVTAKWLHITANQILQKPFQPFKDVVLAHFKFPQVLNNLAQKNYFDAAFESFITKLDSQIALLASNGDSQIDLIHQKNGTCQA